MSLAAVSESTSAPTEEAREPVAARLPQAGRLEGLRAAGNRALGRALAGTAAARRLDRCGAAHAHEDEELLAAGDRALSRAVLSREEARRAKPVPAGAAAAAPAPPPPPPKPAGPACGPDVTQTLKDAVAKTKSDFASWDPAKRKKACIALENPECAGDAWDIVELHNRDWLDAYAPCADKTGAVQEHGDGGRELLVRRLGQLRHLRPHVPAVRHVAVDDGEHGLGLQGLHPADPRRLGELQAVPGVVAAGYKDWPAVASPSGDRPGCSTACPTAYAGAPFTLHWFPASYTENVSHGCEVWSDAYDQPAPPPEFGPPM